MTTLKEFNSYGEDLRRFMLLRTYPIAVKMLQNESDIVVIYSNTAQLDNMLHALMWIGEGLVTSSFFPTVSCAFSVVPAFSGQYYITLPDSGEYGRVPTGDDEIIFSVPKDKVKVLASQLRKFDQSKMGYKHYPFLEIATDHTRPQFYKDLFQECGLDADDVATWNPVLKRPRSLDR